MGMDLNAKGLWLTSYGESFLLFYVRACRDAYIYLSEVGSFVQQCLALEV